MALSRRALGSMYLVLISAITPIGSGLNKMFCFSVLMEYEI